MILPTIASGRVQEHDILLAFASLLVEDLALAPQGRRDIYVSADDAVLVGLFVFVLGRWSCEGVVQEFEDAAPDVGPAGE